MGSKENSLTTSNASSKTSAKPKPVEHQLKPLGVSRSWNGIETKSNVPTKVKPERSDAITGSIEKNPLEFSAVKSEASSSLGVASHAASPNTSVNCLAQHANNNPAPKHYESYTNASDIDYTPEASLQNGLSMLKALKSHIKKLELGSKLRKDVWLRDIAALKGQAAPTTMVAVCGATGAGKSSVLNAILDDNIVPTSGMRACTAVVTEIAYHAAKTINADLFFLSVQEWKDELAVLLDDLIDEDGNIKRTTDLRSESGVAWHKVHAVYPNIIQEKLAAMTTEQIISCDPRIAKLLGATKTIVAKDSREFAKEIAKYIDSNNQRRGDKKKDKDNRNKKSKDDEAALWPLIRQVNVRCPSPALRTGAILVDLPGVADANAARSSIAKGYMKKCDCIWILAPITRAVDDKTARDLLGDAFKSQLMNGGFADVESTISFIATKCDDISCSEVVRALSLEDDPILEEIENRIDVCRSETREYKRKKAAAEAAAKELDAELKDIRAELADHQAHTKAIEDDTEFVLRYVSESSTSKGKNAKKRKNKCNGKGGPPKRRRSDSDSDEPMIGSDDGFIDDDMDLDDDSSDSEDRTPHTSDHSDSDSDSGDEDKDDDSGKEDEEESPHAALVTLEDVKAKIEETKVELKTAREKLNEARKQRKEANDMLANIKKKEMKAQKDKNAFCSLKRSEFSRDVLKEDFRTGLKDLDDAAAEARDPGSFDPTVNLRDYANIDLPTFTVSSRDYIRLTKQVKGDGDPNCFSNVEDTGIPSLQKWCHSLTVPSRQRGARNFRTHLKTFMTSVLSYVEGVGEVTEINRAALREKWESNYDGNESEDEYQDSDNEDGYGFQFNWMSSDAVDIPIFNAMSGGQPLNSGLIKITKKLDDIGEPKGIAPVLTRAFSDVVDENVKQLQRIFKDGLEEKCETGAANAVENAVSTSDEFAVSMHWATYRATLRRHGTWCRDLNTELIAPMTRNMASSWASVFESNLFKTFESAAKMAVNKLLKDVEDSAKIGLRDQVRNQGYIALEETEVAMKKIVDVVSETMNNEQKEVSRCLAPHVQGQLTDGYDRAAEEIGTGSVARQKKLFHDFIDCEKKYIFNGGAEVLLDRLDDIAVAIGKALKDDLANLAEKIEVSMSVLWEGARDNPAQRVARREVIEQIAEITSQLSLWEQADRVRHIDVCDSRTKTYHIS